MLHNVKKGSGDVAHAHLDPRHCLVVITLAMAGNSLPASHRVSGSYRYSDVGSYSATGAFCNRSTSIRDTLLCMGETTCPNGIWERPPAWRFARSASTIPGLTTDEIQALHVAIPPAARDYLDYTTWTKQSPQKIANFLKHMIETLPFLSRYQDAWPAEGCMRDYLQRRNERQKSTWPARVNAKKRNEFWKRNKSPAWKGESVQVKRVIRKTPRERTGAAAVQQFLQTTRPAMDSLLTVFIQGGITDEDHLDAFARLPEAEQAQFLRKDLGLNALHVRIVRLAILEWTKC